MLKGIEKVMNGQCRVGNYSGNVVGDTVEIYYYTTCVGAFNKKLKIAFADNRGFHTSSTTRVVNSIKEYVEDCSYKVVSVDEFKEVTGVLAPIGYWA